MKKKDEIIRILDETYRGAKCGLDFSTPFELLIATILSAQCTDVRVNMVTKVLFKDYGTPYKLAYADIEQIQKIILSLGFFKTKSKNIIECSRAIVEKFDGQVPHTMEELTSLSGVGRKTANVVMSNAFGVPAIAVDTHVFRVSNRLGLANADDVLKTELQLQKAIPRKLWSSMHHAIIWHGRKVCTARKPKCEDCNLSHLCKYYIKTVKEK